MDTPTPAKTSSFSRLAAMCSWVCPIITIIIFVLLMVGGHMITRKTIALVASSALWLLVIGLILGIVALFGISRHGTKGILVPAIVGIILNGLLISLVFASVITSRARRTQQHGSIVASPVRAMWSTTLATNSHLPCSFDDEMVFDGQCSGRGSGSGGCGSGSSGVV